MTWESNNNPPDLPWLEVISETKGKAVNGHGWITDLNYQLREQKVQFHESYSLAVLLSKSLLGYLQCYKEKNGPNNSI